MAATAPSLGERLARLTREGELYERLPEARVRCFACGHRCLIPPSREGICRVRFNAAGTLRVPWGYAAGLQLDPVEKKPFFHALPGAKALSFGMLGCDYHCGYCQNWVTSQALRDPDASAPPREVSPVEIVSAALDAGARIVTSTYNEPLITSEWAVAVFREAKARGLLCSYVSNGNGTPEVLDYIRPWVSLYKVDLKSFRDRHYRELGGTLERVLWTIRALHEQGFWLEIVTQNVSEIRDEVCLVVISPDRCATKIIGDSRPLPHDDVVHHLIRLEITVDRLRTKRPCQNQTTTRQRSAGPTSALFGVVGAVSSSTHNRHNPVGGSCR